MGSSKAPAPTDPTVSIKAQEDANRRTLNQAIAANRVDQSGPFGSISYTQSGTDSEGNPRFTQTNTLDPAIEQGIRDRIATSQGGFQTGMEGLQNTLAQGSGATLERTGDDTGLFGASAERLRSLLSQTGQPGSDGAFDRALQFYDQTQDPFFQRQDEALRTRLENQGLRQGTEAYDRELENMRRGQFLARGQQAADLQNQFFNQGQADQQRQFQQALSGFGAGAGRADQLFGMDNQIANLALANQGQALGGYGQLAGMGLAGDMSPQLANPQGAMGAVPQVGIPSPANAQQAYANYDQQRMQQWQQNQANNNAMLGGLGGIAGTVLGGPIGGYVGNAIFPVSRAG